MSLGVCGMTVNKQIQFSNRMKNSLLTYLFLSVKLLTIDAAVAQVVVSIPPSILYPRNTCLGRVLGLVSAKTIVTVPYCPKHDNTGCTFQIMIII